MREMVTVFAPGSVSNLGSGFDCLGVALKGRGDTIVARSAPRHVTVSAVSDPRITRDPSWNTAAIAARAVLTRAGSQAGVDLAIQKGLPLAGGLGGSAASAVAGAVATDALIEAGLDKEALLEAALEGEAAVAGRHADNVSPCLLGGAVLVLATNPLRTVACHVHEGLSFVVATPSYQVSTAEARSVLPKEVPRGHAVAQAARLAALLLSLEKGEGSLLGEAMEDLIAEPHRRKLYPGYPEARKAALAAGAFGCSVSGAGPTLVAVVPRGREEGVCAAVREAYRSAGHEAEARVDEVDALGARVLP